MAISDYNRSASLNTALAGINVGEGMARGDVSDTVRALMADIANDVAGAVPVSVKRYGAKGDGTTDDAAAIQAAIDANPRKTIILPAGSYLISSPIRITAAPIILDCSKATFILGTVDMNGIEIGNGTQAGKDATIATRIIAPTFNIKAGLPAFTTGSCIYRNFVAFVNVENLRVYGRDGVTTKLYNGVYDYMAAECDTPNATIQWVSHHAVHCKGDGTLTGRTVDCNYDNLRATDIFTAIYIDVGCAGLGFYRPTIYGIFAGGRGIHINTTPGSMGQNFFIDTPDIEAGATTDSAIWLQSGQKAIINGGWVGASMGFGLKIGATFDGADVSCNFVQSKVIIEGPQNVISGGEIVGDGSSVIDGLVIKGERTVIASGVKIRQWAGNGIGWGGANPTGVLIGDLDYSNNANDISALTGFTQATAPTIGKGSTDKPRTYVAAATLSIPPSINFALVTGATAIQTLPLRGSGGSLTLQAGVGGITLNNAGNIILPTSPLVVAANSTVTLHCDGAANYFKSV